MVHVQLRCVHSHLVDLLFSCFKTTVYTNFIMLQREKQQKLNELDVVVVLRLHQIQYMLNSALPQDLSQCLVFNSPGLIRLQHRIKELEKEKAEQKRLYRYLNDNASPREVYDLFSRAAREPCVNSRGLQTRVAHIYFYVSVWYICWYPQWCHQATNLVRCLTVFAAVLTIKKCFSGTFRR